MYEEIIYEVADPVATVTINRPERLNALTARTQVEIKHAMIAAERDERVVGIILTGAGRAFSAGADMRSLAEIAERRAVDQDETLAQLEAECRGREVDPEFRVTWSFIPSLKKPVIAAVNGPPRQALRNSVKEMVRVLHVTVYVAYCGRPVGR